MTNPTHFKLNGGNDRRPLAADNRDAKLVALAIVMDLDSSDVEEACRRHGLDYDRSDFDDIRKAVLEDYGGYVPYCAPHVPGCLGRLE